jgi:hypothetical protein
LHLSPIAAGKHGHLGKLQTALLWSITPASTDPLIDIFESEVVPNCAFKEMLRRHRELIAVSVGPQSGGSTLGGRSTVQHRPPGQASRACWTVRVHQHERKYTIVETAKMSGINPRVYLTNAIGRIADHRPSHPEDRRPTVLALETRP